MSDLLTISDLELWTCIGVTAEERETEQRLLLTIEMTVDSRRAAKTDDVKKTVNYCDVAKDIRSLARTERKTIERLAEDIAQMVQRKHAVSAVTVTVKKFTIPGTEDVSVRIVRE